MTQFAKPAKEFADGLMVANFITSDHVERSRRFYTEVLGGGPTDDKPTVFLETPSDHDHVSSFLNFRVADI